MFTGAPPFYGENEKEIRLAIIKGDLDFTGKK
jgi:hypothetical protein